jgi:hypothetical protein
VVKPIVPSKQMITDKVIKPVPILPFLCNHLTYNCKNARASIT